MWPLLVVITPPGLQYGTREEALIDKLTVRSARFAANRPLVSEGEVETDLYRISKGWAYRYHATTSGCRQILDFLLPGEIVVL